VEKFRTLETLLNEHDGLRRELHALRELIEERDRQQRINEHHHHHHHDHDEDDDSDAQSIRTIGPHELESVPEEDESEEESLDERHGRREEFVRPRTPEPSSLGMHDDDDDQERSNSRDLHEAEHRLRPVSPPPIPEEMERRLGVLSEQLESVFEISRSLQAQHSAAQQTIEALEDKISALEEMVRQTQAAKAAEEAKQAEAAVQREKAQQDSMTAMLAEFKKSFEERLDSFKSEWESERERMDKAKSEWDGRIKTLEEGVSSASGKFELGLSTISTQLAALQNTNRLALRVKDTRHKGGLVTPPSPRSSSAESDSESSHLRASGNGANGRKRSTSRTKRGRSKTKSRSPATSTSATLVDGGSVNGGTGTDSSVASLHSRSSSGSPSHIGNGNVTTDDIDSNVTSPENGVFPPSQFPLTPESSLLHLKSKAGAGASPTATPSSASAARSAQVGILSSASRVRRFVDMLLFLFSQAAGNAQVAVGVFIFGVAAAAVLWRVKEGKMSVVA
jgi:archaellum component FlaC